MRMSHTFSLGFAGLSSELEDDVAATLLFFFLSIASGRAKTVLLTYFFMPSSHFKLLAESSLLVLGTSCLQTLSSESGLLELNSEPLFFRSSFHL